MYLQDILHTEFDDYIMPKFGQRWRIIELRDRSTFNLNYPRHVIRDCQVRTISWYPLSILVNFPIAFNYRIIIQLLPSELKCLIVELS